MGRVCFFILLKRKYKKPILSLNFFQFKILIIFFSLALNTIVWACFAWGSIIDSRSITSSKFLEKYRKSLGIFQFFSEDNAKNRITARIILLITAPNIFIFDVLSYILNFTQGLYSSFQKHPIVKRRFSDLHFLTGIFLMRKKEGQFNKISYRISAPYLARNEQGS